MAPRLREAVDSGYLPDEVAAGFERIIPRLPELCGARVEPAGQIVLGVEIQFGSRQVVRHH